MGKKGLLGRVILFVSALFMLVVFPVYNAKAETNYILTEDGKLVEDTNAYHSQIEPRVSGINIAAETAAPAKVEWCESFTTGVSFEREAGKYYRVQLLCEGTVLTTVNVEAVSTADTCFIPLVVTMESKSYGLFTVNVYETDSSYTNISGATTSDEYEYVKPTKQLATPSGLSWSGTTLSWTAVSGMKGIRYLVDKVDTSSSTGYTYLGERIVANVNNTLDISDFISQYGDGQYRVRMHAVTNANVKKQSAMAVSDIMSYPALPTDPDEPSTAHSITVTSDGNGTASSLESSAVMGTTVTIYVYSVNTGYEFDKWVVESGDVTLADPTSNMQTFTMPNTDVVIKATFKLKGATSYGITVTNDGNGSASASASTAASGATVTVTATPNNGYKFKEWQVVSGGVTLSSTTANPATFTMGSTAVQVKAVFEQITYGITVTNDGNGSASASASTAASGATVTVTATPNNGYKFKEWQVVSGGVTLSNTTANPATFTMGSKAVQVKAVFEQITYGITVTNDGNGSVSADVNTAAQGTTVKVTATPNSGYKFKEWQVVSGGVTLSSTTANPATFTMGSTAVQVKAVFEEVVPDPVSYPIKVTNDGNGAATSNKSNAAEGTQITLTATPNNGYKFKEWQVVSGGVTLSSTTANPATFTMGSKAVQVKAVFEQITYGITVTNDGNGSASASASTAASGATVTVTATPNNGYKFKEWQVVSGGVTLSSTTANPATFTMGSKAVEVKAVFEQITYGITVTNDGNGSASADVNTAASGATVTVTATPNNGYKFKEWQVVSGGVTLSSTTANPATFTMGSKAVEVKAVFEQITAGQTGYTITVTNDGHGTASADKTSVANSWDAVNLTATPDSGYKFKEWKIISGEVQFWGNSTSSQTTIGNFGSSVEIMAVFEEDSSTPIVTYGITVTNDGNGSASANVGTAAKGATVTVTATPNNGYEFKEWQVVSGGVTLSSTTANPATFTMGSANVEVKAVFEQKVTVDEQKVKAFVTRLYTVVLNRQPDENGIADWTTRLVEGSQNGASVSYGFVFSAEFEARNLSNSEKVDVMYATFLDRAADADGKKMWVDALDAGVGLEKIYEGFVMSDEFASICKGYGILAGTMSDAPGMVDRLNLYRNRNIFITEFVARCYTKALGRTRDIDGVEMWCRLIITGEWTPRNVAADGFIHSDEFVAKNTTNGEYVSILYQTFLGRELDADGYELWVGLLDRNEWTRDQVLDGFANSDEFATILASFGLN